MFPPRTDAVFRPTEKINEASKLAAVEAHLQDMRVIAFDRLKINLPDKETPRGQR